MSKDLRVHIAPVGYDSNRVFEPLIKMKADKVYFILHILDNRNHSPYLLQIKKKIKKSEVEQIDEKIDIWDFYECMSRFKRIILNEKQNGNKVWINVSSGTKITAMAGILSCMAWGAVPYYVKIKYPERQKMNEIEIEEVEKTIFPPVYGIEKPDSISMIILNLLNQKSGRIRKVHLIKELVSMEQIKAKSGWGDNSVMQAKHSQLRTLLEPLLDQEFIEVEARGPKSEVILTERGKESLRFFGNEKSK